VRRIAALVALVLLAGACDDSTSSSAGRDPVATTSTTTTMTSVPRYEATATVLEDASHGPQLCLGAILASYPPQCGGPDIVDWNWRGVEGRVHHGDTTWVDDVHVVGTYDKDDDRFRLTEPSSFRPRNAGAPLELDMSPVCAQPTVTIGHTGWPPPPDIVPDDERIANWMSSDPFVLNVIVPPGRAVDAVARIRAVYSGRLCVVERDGPPERERNVISREIGELGKRSPLGRVVSSFMDGMEWYLTVEVVLADREAIAFARQRWGNKVRLESALRPAA
jgi:hypothetical protein